MRLKTYIQESILSESINDKGIMKAVFLAGLPGSGKSYVLSKISDGNIEPRIVNTDKYVEYLKALTPADWNKIVADKTKTLTKNQLALNLNSMLPLLVDGTSSNPSSLLRRKGIVSSIGYDTGMIWINTSLETSIERASKRSRVVPEEYIKKVYKKINDLKPYYKSEFRNFTEINNDEDELTDKIILKSYKKMGTFFSEPIINPIGKKLIDRMIEKGDKYLSDSEYDMSFIKRLVNTWYTK